MSTKSARLLLVVSAVLLSGASTALGQHVHGEADVPFDVYEYHDFQPFAPAPLSEFGDGPQPNEGFFFSFERGYWAISEPEEAVVGNPDAERVVRVGGIIPGFLENSMTTGWLNDESAYTNRYEFGYMVDDCGWFASVNGTLRQHQINRRDGGGVFFTDPNNLLLFLADLRDADGNPGQDGVGDTIVRDIPQFNTTVQHNITEVNGFEVMRTWRWDELRGGGRLEVFAGGRFLQVDDKYRFQGFGDLFASSLDETDFRNRVDNNMVGPQIGLRYLHQVGRWTISSEGRFAPMVNFRNIEIEGEFATNYFGIDPLEGPVLLAPTAFKNAISDQEFSPLVEIRMDATYQLTKAMSIKAGYTGIFTTNVARASNTITWELPTFPIRDPGHGENVMINGVNIGIEINR